MIWTLKPSFGCHSLYLPDGSKAAVIRMQDGGYAILGPEEDRLFDIREPAPLALTIQSPGGHAQASVLLKETSARLRPPLADRISFSWDGCDYAVTQSPHRGFQILRDGMVVGRIEGMLRWSAQLDLAEGSPQELAPLFFALAMRMLHEDDVDIV